MCTLSGVYDHYNPMIPNPLHPQPQQIPNITVFPQLQPQATISPFIEQLGAKEIQELKQLVKDFRTAIKAAKLLDKLMNQPDCEDPDKAKLEERVAFLEKELATLKKKK